MIPQVKPSRWKPHLEAAARQGKTIAQYAREHGLSRHTLYAARQARVGGARPESAKPRLQRPQPMPAGFTVVKLLPPPAFLPAAPDTPTRLHARLPNGIALELACGGSQIDTALLKTLINTLAAMPCSNSIPR